MPVTNSRVAVQVKVVVVLASVLMLSGCLQPAPMAVEGIQAKQLRCEYRVNPLGIDIPKPRLSWIVGSSERGQKQTAYQIQVASNKENLRRNEGDLWDSAKVESDQSIHVSYAGKPLCSRARCYWRVRIWDKDGVVSPWSEPAMWTMGLLEAGDWQGKWIGATDKADRPGSGIGYLSRYAKQADEIKWVQVDLGSTTQIDSLNLFALHYAGPYAMHPALGYGFPTRFSIDVSDDPAFTTSTTIADHTKADYPKPNKQINTFDGGKAGGRYVRVTATKLSQCTAGKKPFCFGLAEIQVFSDGKNVAFGAPVSAKDSFEHPWSIWSKQRLTDGLHFIEDDPAHPANAAVYLRKQVQTENPIVRATAYISGLGYYELYINGQKVGDHVLDPGWTEYRKRVPYVTYDVTEHFKRGANALGVILGNGMYNLRTPDIWSLDHAPWTALPKLLLNVDLQFADGSVRTVASDETWKWSTGPITFNCLRAGETYDARREMPGWNKSGYKDSDWKSAKIVSAPGGRLVAQQHPPVRVAESIRPVKLTEPKPGVYVFDLGVNIAGWARLKTSGKPGQKITLEFNELLHKDGTVDMSESYRFTFGRSCTGELILSGRDMDIFEPRFTYHGFRYVQVTGLTEKPTLDTLTGQWVHSDLEPTGEFACSNEQLNKLQEVILRGKQNYVHHFPRDPLREKLGWTQDAWTCMEMGIYNFDMAWVYRKWFYDMLDAQEANGHVPPIAPTGGWGNWRGKGIPGACSDPWWGGAAVYIPWLWYQYYGDTRLLEEGYEPMKRWVDFLGTTAKDHIVSWQLGDWNEVGHPGVPKRTPIPQTSTCGYYYCAELVSRIASLLGKQAEANKYAELAEKIKISFNKSFLDSATGIYAKDSQSAQIMPLYLDMVPEDAKELVLKRLLENIAEQDNHLSTGFVGLLPLLRGLTNLGYADLVYTIVTQEDFPSWLYMLKNGATAIWEAWDGHGSHNIISLGGPVGSWFYQGLAGIRPDPLGPGFKKIIIKPEIVGDLTWAKGAYRSVHGRISSSWSRDKDVFQLEVEIPANTTATVYVPTNRADTVTESGVPVKQSKGVKFLNKVDDAAIYRIGSGCYSFTSQLSNLKNN